MKTFKYYFPNKIISTIEGYELLLRFHEDLAHLRNSNIVISFKNVSWIEANLVAILGAIIEDLEQKGNIIKIIDRVKSANDILIRNEFLTNYGYQAIDDKFSTQIPYRKFTHEQSEEYNFYIQKELLEKPEFPKHSLKLQKEIERNIYELFENARTHGRCNFIHTCGQFYPTRKKLHITIVDTGDTIIRNVRDYLSTPEKLSSECIDWAIISGNTTKTGNISGGLGLGLIFDFITLNEGSIQIISSNGYLELRDKKILKNDLNFSFNGTIVNLEFDIKNRETFYHFKDEKFNNIDINNIF